MRAIAQIDKDITAIHRKLRTLAVGLDRMDAASWQAAWDRFPDLYQQERDLYRERGDAQMARDEAAAKAARRQSARPVRAKKCPTCGHAVYAA